MTSTKTLIALAAAAGALCLAACETTDYGPASAGTSASTGSAVTSGSSTGTPAGSDSNVKGNASAGSASAPPAQ